jgi:uncharacterized protein (DUF4415 family)
MRKGPDLAAGIRPLTHKPNEKIDFTDIPETLQFDYLEVGKFYRPIKKPISLRVDADVLAWFQLLGPKYQTRMNQALRYYMVRYARQAKEQFKSNKKKPRP